MSFSKWCMHPILFIHTLNDSLVLNDSLGVNKLRSGTLSIQSVSNRTCGRVLYIRESRKTCIIPGSTTPCSQREITLVSENPSICATFFCEYPAQCLYFLSLLGNRPCSMHRVYAITRNDIRQGKLLFRQILWITLWRIYSVAMASRPGYIL